MKRKKIIFGTIFSIIIIVLLVKQIDLGRIQDFKLKINYPLMIIAFLFTFISSLIRAIRFNYSLAVRLKILDIFRITLFYNLYTRLFPGGIGELTFPYLIKKNTNQAISTGLSSILLTRIFDILVIALFLGGGLIFFSNIDIENKKILYIGYFLIALIAWLSIQYLNKIVKVFANLSNKLVSDKNKWLKKINNNLYSISEALKINKKKKKQLFITTVLFWGSNFLMVQLFCISIGLAISYGEAILIASISVVAGLIPLNTIGGFGYKEGGLTLGLLLIGVAKHDAVIYSFLIHIVSISLALGGAFVGVLLDIKSSKVLRKSLKIMIVF
ncbi:flippase-like domain-containing protein [Patescibacteria group bacterium AH-259-L05]|nr:flippase-like domain-containing protein [Patescibacteria group bacterium AH-259-L05]